MSLFIDTLEGVRYDLTQYGLKPLKLEIDSPSPRIKSEQLDGRDGDIHLETTFGSRSLRATFFMQSVDFTDYYLFRNEVYRLFDARTFFYLIDSREPKRRWKVKTASTYKPERLNSISALFEIEFISPSPYVESFGTTLNPFTFDAELWQVGQGVISEDLIYTHSATTFQIYNGSDVRLDPRELPLKITFTGASTNLIIRNKTNGDEWSYTGSTIAGDSLVLDGIRSLKNGVSVFGATNKKVISLEKGFNDFEIVGASGFTISFDFRFFNI